MTNFERWKQLLSVDDMLDKCYGEGCHICPLGSDYKYCRIEEKHSPSNADCDEWRKEWAMAKCD